MTKKLQMGSSMRHPSSQEYSSTLASFIYSLSQKKSKIDTLRQVLPHAMRISQSERGALLVAKTTNPIPESIMDEGVEESNLIQIAQQGMPPEIIDTLIKGDMGQRLQQGKQLLIGLKSLQLDAIQSLLRRHKLKGLIGIPLQFDRVVLGAIVLATGALDGQFFNPQQRQQLMALAHLTSLFLDHSRLQTEEASRATDHHSAPQPFYEVNPSQPAESSDELESLLAAMMNVEDEIVNQNQELSVLNSLSSQVNSTLQLGQVLDQVLDQTTDALSAGSGWCYLYEDDLLHLSRQKGLSQHYAEGLKLLKPGDGVEGMAFIRNEPITRDAALFHDDESRFIVLQEGLKTVAAVPLVQDTKPFGVLAVGTCDERVWTVRDERMLTSISQQASNAVYNARKYTEVENEIELLKTKNVTLAEDKSQLTVEFERLKHQTREILRLQERAWAAQAASSQLDQVVSKSNPNPNSPILVSIRRALEALSSAK